MGARVFFCFNYKNISIQSKDAEIKKYPLCLGNISGDFSANNLKKKQDEMGECMAFLLITDLLMLVLLLIYINI